jgi:hypothetical protein
MARTLVYHDSATDTTEPFFGVAYTKEQLEAYKKYKELQKRKPKAEEFVWILFRYGEELFPEVDKASLIRLLFISTFIDKDKEAKENRLTDNRGKTFFTKKEVKQVLKLSSTCFDNFWNEMISNNIFALNDNKEVVINDEMFQYGEIKELDENRIRLFCGAVRRLYIRCNPRQHKLLGYIFRMIPFVSKEYNIICHNPEEVNMDMVRPMTLENFCITIGYDVSHAQRLLKDILSVQIDGQQLVKYVSDGKLHTSYLVVNPRAYYAGYHTAELSVLFN